MSALTIRPFNGLPGDEQALRELARAWGRDFWSPDDLLASLKTAGTKLLAAVDASSTWHGMLLGREGLDEAELFFIFVDPKARRQGIGQRLFAAWAVHLKALGQCQQVLLEVRPSNLAAISLYQKLGFAVASRRPAYYTDGEDAVIMVWNIV